MSHFDELFDKYYAERMRHQTDRDFSDTDWAALASRLDEADSKRHRNFPLWLTGVLAGLLLFSNLIWFFKFRNLNTEVKSVEGQIFEHRDTIFRTIVEHRIDTVFIKSANIQKPQTAGKRFSSDRNELETASESEILLALNRRFPNHQPYFSGNDVALHDQTSPVNSSKLLPQSPKNLDFAATAQTFTNFSRIEKCQTYPLLFEKKPLFIFKKMPEANNFLITKIVSKKADRFKNDWWMLSLASGIAIPVSDDLTKKKGYQFGTQLEYGITANHSIWADFSQTGLSCSGNSTDDYGLEIPYRHDYKVAEFTTTNGPKESWRIGLGARWRQNEGKKWGRIGLGFGYIFEIQKSYDLQLQWQSISNPQSKPDIEFYRVPKEGYPIGYVHGDIGIEWRLSHSMVGSFNLWKEVKGHYKDGMPGYFGAKLGLGYRF